MNYITNSDRVCPHVKGLTPAALYVLAAVLAHLVYLGFASDAHHIYNIH